MRCAALVAASLAVAPEASAESRNGRWRLVDNPYRSHIELIVSDTSFFANVGCTAISLERDAEGRPNGSLGVLIHEAACFRDERGNHAANAYWDRIVARITNMRSVEVRGRRLLLTSTDGRRLVFVRVRGR